MVARGDLGGGACGRRDTPNTQRRIVEKCICAKRPVIIATQMLYSMVKSPRPTRAEVSDVASAIYERVDAVMLSDETAMGDYPVESVETMARVAREIERDETHFKPMIDMDMVSVNHEITAQLARSAVRASTNLPIKYVVLDTKTGRTGRYRRCVPRPEDRDGPSATSSTRSVFWRCRTVWCRFCAIRSCTTSIISWSMRSDSSISTANSRARICWPSWAAASDPTEVRRMSRSPTAGQHPLGADEENRCGAKVLAVERGAEG